MLFRKEKAIKKANSFILGAADVFPLNGTDDMVVIGNVSGTVSSGDTVSIINFGDDNALTLSGEVCEI